VVKWGPPFLERYGRNRDREDLAITPDRERSPVPFTPVNTEGIEVIFDGKQVAA